MKVQVPGNAGAHVTAWPATWTVTGDASWTVPATVTVFVMVATVPMFQVPLWVTAAVPEMATVPATVTVLVMLVTVAIFHVPLWLTAGVPEIATVPATVAVPCTATFRVWPPTLVTGTDAAETVPRFTTRPVLADAGTRLVDPSADSASLITCISPPALESAVIGVPVPCVIEIVVMLIRPPPSALGPSPFADPITSTGRTSPAQTAFCRTGCRRSARARSCRSALRL